MRTSNVQSSSLRPLHRGQPFVGVPTLLHLRRAIGPGNWTFMYRRYANFNLEQINRAPARLTRRDRLIQGEI
jgi:hypothetical protein